MRTLVVPAHLDLAAALGAQQDSAAAERLVDGVDARGQLRLLFQCRHVREQGMGESLLLHEPGDDDSGLLVSVARPVEVPSAFQRKTDEDPVVGCPVGDDHVLAGIGLWSVLLEPVRDGEDDHLQGDRVLRAELRDGPFSEVRDLLAELLQRGDFLTETPRHADGLPRLDHVLQRYAWNPFEFLPGPVAGQVEEHPHRGLGKACIVVTKLCHKG